MANDNVHIIRKVNAELTVPSPNHHADEQLRRAIQGAVEHLGSLLDEHFGDALYRVELLSVELQLQQADMPRLAQLLEKALAQKVAKAKQTTQRGDSGQDSPAEVDRIHPFQGDMEQKVEKLPPEQQVQDLLTHFLKTGRFPWWSHADRFPVLEEALRDLSVDQWLQIIKPLAQHNVGVLKRLAAQFPEELVQQLIKKSSGDASAANEVLGLLKEIRHFLETQQLGYGRRQQTMTLLYEKALAGMLSADAHELLLGDLMMLAAKDIEAESRAWISWLKKADTNNSEWIRLFEEHIAEPTEMVMRSDNQLQMNETDDFSEAETGDFAVSNGGIVLLHPFFEGLFDNLGLLEEGTFSSDAARERAVCLLHYLATGSEEFKEPELLLAKFLCEWPLGESINRFLPISEYEKEECAALLRSAIKHWDVLKNTSIEGLRSNFLQRKGILREEAFGWSLYLEDATQDVLLEKLPWGLSVIKCTWMDEMLTVNWR